MWSISSRNWILFPFFPLSSGLGRLNLTYRGCSTVLAFSFQSEYLISSLALLVKAGPEWLRFVWLEGLLLRFSLGPTCLSYGFGVSILFGPLFFHLKTGYYFLFFLFLSSGQCGHSGGPFSFCSRESLSGTSSLHSFWSQFDFRLFVSVQSNEYYLLYLELCRTLWVMRLNVSDYGIF